MDHTSHKLAAVSHHAAFLDITISQCIQVSSRSAKNPFRLGKAKRHRDGLTLFRLRALEPSASDVSVYGSSLRRRINSKCRRGSLKQETTREFGMKTILSILGATALLASAAYAAPLNPTAVGTPEASNTEQVRLVCNQFG